MGGWERKGKVPETEKCRAHSSNVMCVVEKKNGKADGVRWQSALNDPDFILQGKGNYQRSMVGFLL